MSTTKASRGTKRKRDGENETVVEDVSVKLRTKLHHEAKEVKKAGKKVKTFETQKLVKKLKDARTKGDENLAKDIEEQLAFLKQLDHDHISIQSIRNKFKKDKFLSRNPACEAAVSSELTLSPVNQSNEKNKAVSIVESRFLSSKILSKEVDRVLRSLRAILGGATDADDAFPAEQHDDVGEWGGFGAAGSEPTTKSKQKVSSRHDVVVASDGSEDDNEDLQYSSNFEDEEGDADGWESGSIQGDDDNTRPAIASGSDDEDSEGISSDTDAAPKKSPKKPPTKKATAVEGNSNSASGSTFLPSLSVGFVRGDSDSEWSEGEADAGDLPKRKNRRGQRARKAIWEKKYGRNANHVKKQQEQEKQETMAKAYAKAGRGRGRGVSGPPAGGGRGRGHEIPSSIHNGFGRGRSGDGISNTNSNPRGGLQSQGTTAFPHSNGYQPGERRVDATNMPMHPSWEAKKRLREKQSAAIVPAQGTRMTFI